MKFSIFEEASRELLETLSNRELFELLGVFGAVEHVTAAVVTSEERAFARDRGDLIVDILRARGAPT